MIDSVSCTQKGAQFDIETLIERRRERKAVDEVELRAHSKCNAMIDDDIRSLVVVVAAAGGGSKDAAITGGAQ